MSNFEEIIKSVLIEEGGYVNDPLDNGGETNFGISKKTYPQIDIRNLTIDDAIEIYKKDFWIKYKFHLINSFIIQKKLFSMCVNMGFKRAFSILQKTINSISEYNLKEDGIIGYNSLNAINEFSSNKIKEEELLNTYKENLKIYYISLNQKRFEKGWINRAMS